MEEKERKVYEMKGTVQISSEEYRDLIEEVASVKIESVKRDKEYWDEYRAKRDAQDKLKDMTESYNALFEKYKKLKELILTKLSTENKDDEKVEDTKGTVIAMFAEFFKD